MEFFNYSFIHNAIIIGFISSIICGVISPFILFRNLIFITSGISHASFGGIGIAFYLNYPLIYGSILFSTLGSFFLSIFEYKKIQDKNVILSIFSVSGMSLGSLFIYLSPNYMPDINSYIFGNIFFISNEEVINSIYLFLIIITFFFFFYKEWIALSFDLEFLSLKKFPVLMFNILFYLLIALSIIVLIHVVGTVLVVSLMTIPASIASILTRSIYKMIFISIFLSMIFIYLGIFLSFLFNIPSGPMITLPAAILWIIVNLINKIKFYIGIKRKLKN